MNTQEQKVTFGIPESIEFCYLDQIGRFIASMGGVMKASINPKIPGIVTVDYDPRTTTRERIMGAVAAAGIDLHVLAA